MKLVRLFQRRSARKKASAKVAGNHDEKSIDVSDTPNGSSDYVAPEFTMTAPPSPVQSPRSSTELNRNDAASLYAPRILTESELEGSHVSEGGETRNISFPSQDAAQSHDVMTSHVVITQPPPKHLAKVAPREDNHLRNDAFASSFKNEFADKQKPYSVTSIVSEDQTSTSIHNGGSTPSVEYFHGDTMFTNEFERAVEEMSQPEPAITHGRESKSTLSKALFMDKREESTETAPHVEETVPLEEESTKCVEHAEVPSLEYMLGDTSVTYELVQSEHTLSSEPRLSLKAAPALSSNESSPADVVHGWTTGIEVNISAFIVEERAVPDKPELTCIERHTRVEDLHAWALKQKEATVDAKRTQKETTTIGRKSPQSVSFLSYEHNDEGDSFQSHTDDSASLLSDDSLEYWRSPSELLKLFNLPAEEDNEETDASDYEDSSLPAKRAAVCLEESSTDSSSQENDRSGEIQQGGKGLGQRRGRPEKNPRDDSPQNEVRGGPLRRIKRSLSRSRSSGRKRLGKRDDESSTSRSVKSVLSLSGLRRRMSKRANSKDSLSRSNRWSPFRRGKSKGGKSKGDKRRFFKGRPFVSSATCLHP